MNTVTPVIARFRFLPERRDEFVDGGSEVVEMQFDSIAEVSEYAEAFADAIVEAFALVNGQVVACGTSDAE